MPDTLRCSGSLVDTPRTRTRSQLEERVPSVTRTGSWLVNDGSTDSTLAHIVAWAREDARIKIVNLSRNFGHQSASTAGLDYAHGDAVALLDADLQDPLSVVHRMIDRYTEGYDVVYGQRAERPGESPFKRFTAWLFYWLMRYLVHKDLPVDTRDFRLIPGNCLDGLRRLRESLPLRISVWGFSPR